LRSNSAMPANRHPKRRHNLTAQNHRNQGGAICAFRNAGFGVVNPADVRIVHLL
jgi:hypothetical protein